MCCKAPLANLLLHLLVVGRGQSPLINGLSGVCINTTLLVGARRSPRLCGARSHSDAVGVLRHPADTPVRPIPAYHTREIPMLHRC